MDYDATDIATTYDRGRNHSPEVMNLWMDVVSSCIRDQQVKTVGSGLWYGPLLTQKGR